MTHIEPVLRAEGLSFGWPGQRLFNSLDIRIPPGVSLVTGDDGCGKTTLLRLLAGELQAEAGRIRVQGAPLAQAPEARRQQVFWIDPHTTAHDAISANAFLQRTRHQHPPFDDHLLAELLEAFALAPHLDKPLYMLSTGSKRKVWLSAALAAGAVVTLIDQPFAALDAPSIRCVNELLLEAAEHPRRAWVIADFEAPEGLAINQRIDLSAASR